jgi:hypothetical protein
MGRDTEACDRDLKSGAKTFVTGRKLRHRGSRGGRRLCERRKGLSVGDMRGSRRGAFKVSAPVPKANEICSNLQAGAYPFASFSLAFSFRQRGIVRASLEFMVPNRLGMAAFELHFTKGYVRTRLPPPPCPSVGILPPSPPRQSPPSPSLTLP